MNTTPHWDRSTKQLVSATVLILAGLLLYSFRTILIPIVLVCLFSYIFAPVVGWVSRLLGVGRGWAVLVLYLVGLAAMVTLPAVTVPVIVDEVENLIKNLDAIAQRLLEWLQQWDQYQFEFMGYTFVLPEIDTLISSIPFDLDRVFTLLEGTLSPVAGGAVSVVRTVASGIGWFTVLAVMAYYLLVDAERLAPALLAIVPPAYRDETSKLLGQVNATWNAFLRGQIVLCAVIAIVTTIAMSAVGIRFAVALGIIAGILEIIPNLGPTLASVPAILLALFQGSSFIPMSKFGVAILVALIYWMIQSLENTLLVPRIMGSTLNLHPLIIILGVLGGAALGGTLGTFGGILGVLLAAPVLATLRHFIRYIYHKLADLDPFPPPPSFASMVRARDVRAILFDLDGTLLDSDDMLVARWAQRLERIPLLRRLYNERQLARGLVMAAESPMNTAITLLDFVHLDNRIFALTEWFRLVHGQRKPAEYVAVDGTLELIRALSEEYDLAIITTRNRSDTELFLEFFDLHDCFKVIVTRQDVKRLKPHPEPVKLAAEQLGYPPEQCVMVGDTTVDVQAGKRAGSLTVGVLCGFGERPEMERLKPNLLLETTALLGQRLPSGVQMWSEDW
jgi:HAD superfamily hydrolase (TIGR01509 family)